MVVFHLRDSSPTIRLALLSYGKRLCGSLAQLVEQRLEEPCVPSSSLGGATILHRSIYYGIMEDVECCFRRELDYRVAVSSVKRRHAQELIPSMPEWKSVPPLAGCALSGRSHHYLDNFCASGETGIHAALRWLCLRAWRFKSSLAHHQGLARFI